MSDVELSETQLRSVAKFTAQELRGEFQAMLKATAQAPAIPPPNRPPIDFDGLDAKVVERLRSEVTRDLRQMLEDATDDFVPDAEISRRISERTQATANEITQKFDSIKADLIAEVRKVVETECGKLRTEFMLIFEDLDMNLTEGAPRRATRARLAELWAMQKGSAEWKVEFWKAIRATSITGAVGSVGAFFAYLWSRGGPPH